MHALSKCISRKFIKVDTAPTDQKILKGMLEFKICVNVPLSFLLYILKKVSCLCDTSGYCITWLCDTIQGIALNGGISKCCCCLPLGVIMVALEMLHGHAANIESYSNNIILCNIEKYWKLLTLYCFTELLL